MDYKTEKYRLLRKGILFDFIGMISYVFPGIGPFIDILWAPIAASQLAKMYPGTRGRVGAVIVFLEELSPGFDFIPTFTITWVYVFIWKREKTAQSEMELKVTE